MNALEKFSRPFSPRLALVALVGAFLACGSDKQNTSGEEEVPSCASDCWHTQDFEGRAVGPYTPTDVGADWNNPPWMNGVEERRAAIALDAADARNRVLEVLFPEGKIGAMESGVQWRMSLEKSHNSLFLSYRVRFADDFDFRQGGKLPGLGGGTANTGGEKPTGIDGWSARVMWGPEGRITHYVYHPDQPGSDGQHFALNQGTARFIPGQWHQITTRIMMNAAGERNGRLELWIDGQLVLSEDSLRFRDAEELSIDKLLFETFFGGSTDAYRPTKHERIQIDDVKIGAAE